MAAKKPIKKPVRVVPAGGVPVKTTKTGKAMQRLKEPSTWAALAALAALFGVPLGGGDIAAAAGGLAAMAAIILPEGG